MHCKLTGQKSQLSLQPATVRPRVGLDYLQQFRTRPQSLTSFHNSHHSTKYLGFRRKPRLRRSHLCFLHRWNPQFRRCHCDRGVNASKVPRMPSLKAAWKSTPPLTGWKDSGGSPRGIVRADPMRAALLRAWWCHHTQRQRFSPRQHAWNTCWCPLTSADGPAWDE